MDAVEQGIQRATDAVSNAVALDWRDQPLFAGDEVISIDGELVRDESDKIREYVLQHLQGYATVIEEEN
jgi:hypothetical protein